VWTRGTDLLRERTSLNKMVPKESAAAHLTHSLVIVAEGRVKKTG
jgi:hypothetical protein